MPKENALRSSLLCTTRMQCLTPDRMMTQPCCLCVGRTTVLVVLCQGHLHSIVHSQLILAGLSDSQHMLLDVFVVPDSFEF